MGRSRRFSDGARFADPRGLEFGDSAALDSAQHEGQEARRFLSEAEEQA